LLRATAVRSETLVTWVTVGHSQLARS